jgi:hypothetical protein
MGEKSRVKPAGDPIAASNNNPMSICRREVVVKNNLELFLDKLSLTVCDECFCRSVSPIMLHGKLLKIIG